ncbi:hypothetical protein FRC12_004737 [Ceratobasidium sp. 428]|nr:hypothetical protein FRC12_004737 [Ceratobasidium sp. 428]
MIRNLKVMQELVAVQPGSRLELPQLPIIWRFGNSGTDFQPRIPAIGAELDKDAQVWEIYVEETDRSDKELVKSWNDSLDVLLIFVSPPNSATDYSETEQIDPSGSAVLSYHYCVGGRSTCFERISDGALSYRLVIESSKRLQADPAETSAQTLQAMSHILIAISNGQPVDSSTPSGASPSQFSPSRSSVLVNSLWYLSLTLSVAVSLVAMVSKSWCNAFMSNRSGSKYEQGRRRQRKWNAIERWGMENVFVYLPTLMHLALRLSVYLWDIYIVVAVPVCCVTAIFVALYAIATILPSLYQDCPYSTPLFKPIARMSRNSGDSPGRQATLKGESTPADEVTSQMLLWLISNCEDSRLVDIALRSIAGARHDFSFEPLVEAGVLELLAQRLNNCLVIDWRTNTIQLKPTSSVDIVSLYAQAMFHLLAYDVGFKSSNHQVQQLSYRQLAESFHTKLEQTAPGLRGLAINSTLAEDHSLAAIATSILAPLCYARKTNSSTSQSFYPVFHSQHHDFGPKVQSEISQLLQNHLNKAVTLHDRALLALLETAPHWIIGHMGDRHINPARGSSIMLLVQLVHSPSCSAPDFQYAIGLSLAVAAVLLHDYPGWEHPSNSIEGRATRAIEVYRYYKAEHNVEPKVLVVSGLLGLLRNVSRTPMTFQKDEVTMLIDMLTQIGDFRTIADHRLHTLPDTLTIAQHAKMTLLETLQAVVDGRSDFGETALVPCFMQLLEEGYALGDLNIAKLALKVFLDPRTSGFRGTCSDLLLKCLSKFYDSLTDLESAQISGLIDISLGNDAYSAPIAMICLWRHTEWLIGAANNTPDGQPATVLVDMLKHDAFALLRAKAPDLPISPGNIFEVGLAEMWYPLLKEMMSHKYAALIVGESDILGSMLSTDGGWRTVPYLEELRDGQPWGDIIWKLRDMSSCDVEVDGDYKLDMRYIRML